MFLPPLTSLNRFIIFQHEVLALVAHLLNARHHSDAGRHRLEGLSQGDQRRRAEVGHVLALDVHHLVAGLQAGQVGAAALHHRQDVTGPGSAQSEAKSLWPVLVGRWEAEVCKGSGEEDTAKKKTGAVREEAKKLKSERGRERE